MVRYKSQQNIKKELKQNPLFAKEKLGLKIDLKSKPQTILKTQNTTLENKTETISRLKRKLIVYKDNGKFYIEHFTAYALKLTNVRAIMLDNPRLVEINLQSLNKIQNDRDIEIEYKKLDKEKEGSSIEEQLTDVLEELRQEYGIGIHGIDKGNSEEKQRRASNICKEGLNISNNSKTILSTAISLGTNKESNQLEQDITQYKFGNGTRATVVIAVPQYIESEKGERIFLGFPEENKKTAGQQYEEHCILDRICGIRGNVPPEFILGYYCENSDGSNTFMKNLKHYSCISQKSREDLYGELSMNMDDISKNINELIANGDIEQLRQMKQRMQECSLQTYIIDNAMTLAQKYNEHEKIQSTGVKGTRSIFLGDDKTAEQMQSSTSSRKIRKILLDSYQDVKRSELSGAKEKLREGIEEPEKNYEGKEI